MSIYSEITRVKNAKAAIKAALAEKGVDAGDGKLDTYAEKIGQIHTGDGVPVFVIERSGTSVQIPAGTTKIKVNDPNCIRRSCLWDYEVLEPQIKNLWAYRR